MAEATLHEQYRLRDSIKTSSNRSFGFVFTIVFAVIGFMPLVFGDGIRIWSLVLATVILVLSLAFPKTLMPLNFLWTKFGQLLYRISNPLILGVLFFLIVTPTGLLMRAFGKTSLKIGFDHNIKSYWIERKPPGPMPESMKQQF